MTAGPRPRIRFNLTIRAAFPGKKSRPGGRLRSSSYGAPGRSRSRHSEATAGTGESKPSKPGVSVKNPYVDANARRPDRLPFRNPHSRLSFVICHSFEP
jgi:hypothetical protein